MKKTIILSFVIMSGFFSSCSKDDDKKISLASNQWSLVDGACGRGERTYSQTSATASSTGSKLYNLYIIGINDK